MLSNKKGQSGIVCGLIIIVIMLLPFIIAGAVLYFIIKAFTKHFSSKQTSEKIIKGGLDEDDKLDK